ncbi:hypothetical protein T03_11365 [Trichinella britovi]|uniref:Uncharacterized protein n=1 Tax=Trichinella britovi TaxID=45882 RepID=A0A0V1CDE2_TRIBR|nr:hypothetical protein T03_11365 [Trichinella britovi]
MAGKLDAAEQIRVRIAQRQCFRREIDARRANGCVGAQSRLRQLRPLCLKIGQSQRLRLRTLSWISPPPQPIREADEEGHITQVCVSNHICAVHLELVREISTVGVMQALRRFIAWRAGLRPYRPTTFAPSRALHQNSIGLG